MKLTGQRFSRAATFGIILTVAFLVFAGFRIIPFLAAAEASTRDFVHAHFYPHQPSRGDIVLVLIEETTLATLPYRSPIDRGFLADMLQSLDALGPRAIGIDLLFDQPTEPEKDERLLSLISAGAMATPVIVATAGQHNGLTEAQTKWLFEATRDARVGLVELAFDPFNDVVRAAPGLTQLGGRSVISLASAMAQAGGIDVPDTGFEIAFTRPGDGAAFAPRLNAAYHSYLNETQIAGKFVLIGVSLDNADRHATPLSALTANGDAPGVESHAQALAQLIDQREISEITIAGEVLSTFLAALACVFVLLAPLSVIGRIAIFGAILVIIIASPAVAVGSISMRLPVLPPLLSGAVAGAIVAFIRWRAEALTRHRLRDAFGRFVAPAIVKRIEREPDALQLGGERREITCVFTDVAGFTTLCEGLAADELVDLLNRYLGGASEIFINHGGTIDKFVGDAVVGFFGAPLPQQDHAAAAIRMAVALDAFATRFAASEQAGGRDFGITRIGVHSGEATVGNFGGDLFFDYTAMGDTVNVAARLEGANKAFGGQLCISDDALTRAGGLVEGVITRPIGALRVKGRDAPMQAHEAFVTLDTRAGRNDAYLKAYAALDTGGAAALFADLAATYPDDGLIAFHHNRCKAGESGTIITLKEK